MDATLETWLVAAATAAGLPPEVVAGLDPALVDLVLDLARDAAHGVARPGAPLAAFAVGLAVGHARPPDLLAATVAAARDVSAHAASFGPIG